MTKAAVTGDYTDIRFIKGRKVAQVVIEIPIEAAGAFVEAFGTPLPDRTVPVALARLLPDTGLKQKLRDSVEHEKSRRNWHELSRAQQAGIASNEKGFWTFLNEERHYNCQSEADAAEAIREICGCKESRRELDSVPAAAGAWHNLYAEYIAWLRGAAA